MNDPLDRWCATPYCRNEAARYKSGRYRKHCAKCRSRNFKKNAPFKYFYNQAKQRARNRGIPFTLTLEEYREEWEKSGCWEKKLASHADQTWTMDRKDVNYGYEPGNVQIIERWRNVFKWHTEDKFAIHVVWRRRWAEKHGKEIEDCPF